MKISIVLPHKEKYSYPGAGSVSIFVSNHLKNSIYKKNILILGAYQKKPLDKKNFIGVGSHKFFSNYFYLRAVKQKIKNNLTDIIELHNRPNYFSYLKKNFPDKKIIIFFHNNPLELNGSKSIEERLLIYQKADKIIFLSRWIKDQFLLNLNIFEDSKFIILYPGIKPIKKFPIKQKLILFVGKLNHSKGYDTYLDAVRKFIKKNPDWKSISIGTEKRRIIKKDTYTKEIGEVANSKVLKYYEYASISIANSFRDEPLGRSPIESSSRGCVPIVSNMGGLTETINKHGVILKKNTPEQIFHELVNLSKNKKKLLLKQKNIFKNFSLKLGDQSKNLDTVRKSLFPSPNLRCLKILHITNLNDRFNGRLHYNTGKRINNGLIKLGHNVQTISDRDFLHYNSSILNFSAKNKFNNKLIATHKNFHSDLIILGHADSVTRETLLKLKQINNPKFCQWFLDPVSVDGPDYNKNYNRIKKLDDLLDATFLTTHPNALNFKINNSFFIPNPADSSFETLEIYKENGLYDLFFAMSHGVHRGNLKYGKFDKREIFLKKIIQKTNRKKILLNFFGLGKKQPIWANDFFANLKNCKMALNLSRGKPTRYYSSDRIAQLIGNGILTFIDKKTQLNDIIIDKKEAIFYNNLNDLVKKLEYYKKNTKIRNKIAKTGKKYYLKKFNSTLVARYMINKTFKLKSNYKFYWDI